jgi:hypothetical protein
MIIHSHKCGKPNKEPNRRLFVLPVLMKTTANRLVSAASRVLFAMAFLPGVGAAQDSSAPPSETISWAWGSQRAIIEVVEFTDFGCPYCASFHTDSYGALFADYVETGKVRWVFVPFASGRFRGALEATLFAACGVEQGKDIASLRRLIFERQSEWLVGNAVATFAAYADEVGLIPAEYRACISSERTGDRIRENGRRALDAGVRGTPTLLVDGFPVMGALPIDFYRQLLDRTIERVSAGGGSR